MRFRVLLECASHWGWVRFSDPSEILSKVNLKVCQWSVVPTKVRTRLLYQYCCKGCILSPDVHASAVLVVVLPGVSGKLHLKPGQAVEGKIGLE